MLRAADPPSQNSFRTPLRLLAAFTHGPAGSSQLGVGMVQALRSPIAIASSST